MDTSNLVANIEGNYDAATDAIDRGVQADHFRIVQGAKNGASVTLRDDRITDEGLAARAVQSVGAARDDALKVIDKEIASARRKMVDAPSADEANYISAISQRDDMTREEVGAALDRYTSHAAQHAIRAAAKRSGLKDVSLATDVERHIDDLHHLRANVVQEFDYFNILNASPTRRHIVRDSFKGIANGVDAYEHFKDLFER